MRLLVLLAPLLPSLFGPVSAPPPAPASLGVVVENVEFTYYEVEGNSPQEIAAALATHGPEYGGHRFFGMTEWSLTADYDRNDGPAGCTLSEITVEMDVETRLPYWRRSSARDARLRTDWYQFLGALDRHERGHRELAREAADVVRQRLATLRTPTCDTIRQEARKAAIAVMDTYDARHRAYDSSTGHGYVQGAVWPRLEKPHTEALYASVK